MKQPVELVKLELVPPPDWALYSEEEMLGLTMEQMTADCPICGASPMDPHAECLHVFCQTHQVWTVFEVERSWSGSGFAGGRINHVEWKCGCSEHDESGDVAAAR